MINACFVSWTLTNRCTYSCPHCITANDTGGTPLTDEQIGEGLVVLAEKMNTLKPAFSSLRLLGGEPTLVDHLAEKTAAFLEVLKSDRTSLCLQTNLSQSAEYYLHFIEVFYSLTEAGSLFLHLQTAFYPDFADADEFMEKLRLIKSRFPLVQLNVKLILDDSNYDSMKVLSDEFATKGIEVDLYPNMANIYDLASDLSTESVDVLNQSMLCREQLLKEEPGSNWKSGLNIEVKYDDGSFLYFKNYNHLLVYAGLENLVFDDYYCSAGHTSARIEPDGTVYRSQAPCIRIPDSILGNILGGFAFYDRMKKCPVSIGCNCMSRLYTGTDSRPVKLIRRSLLRRILRRLRG